MTTESLLFRQKALRHLHIADHILTQSYPLLKDPKLLLACADNLAQAITHMVTMAVTFERDQKTIPPFHDSDDVKFNTFTIKLAASYKISPEQIGFMRGIKCIKYQHKESPMAFTRKDSFIICDKEYTTTTLTVKEMKKFIDNAKTIFALIDTAITTKS